MKRLMALLLCAVLAAPACATSQTPRMQTAPQALTRPADRDVLSDFAAQLPLGSRVKATLAGNRSIRGTLVKRTDEAIVVQPRTRIPEPLVEVRFDSLVALEQELPSGGVARAIAIGVGVGVSAALGMLLLLAATLGD
jgi:hypothetical protein